MSKRPWASENPTDPWEEYGRWIKWMEARLLPGYGEDERQEDWDGLPFWLLPGIYAACCDLADGRNAEGMNDTPKTQCPRCGAWVEDFDGFGVLAHEACGYCSHPSGYGGVCQICGGNDEDPTHTWGAK